MLLHENGNGQASVSVLPQPAKEVVEVEVCAKNGESRGSCGKGARRYRHCIIRLLAKLAWVRAHHVLREFRRRPDEEKLVNKDNALCGQAHELDMSAPCTCRDEQADRLFSMCWEYVGGGNYSALVSASLTLIKHCGLDAAEITWPWQVGADETLPALADIVLLLGLGGHNQGESNSKMVGFQLVLPLPAGWLPFLAEAEPTALHQAIYFELDARTRLHRAETCMVGLRRSYTNDPRLHRAEKVLAQARACAESGDFRRARIYARAFYHAYPFRGLP